MESKSDSHIWFISGDAQGNVSSVSAGHRLAHFSMAVHHIAAHELHFSHLAFNGDEVLIWYFGAAFLLQNMCGV